MDLNLNKKNSILRIVTKPLNAEIRQNFEPLYICKNTRDLEINMILLFGEKAHKSSKNSNIKNHPIENSGILARSTQPKSLLAANEYDIYMFSVQAQIDYEQYAGQDYILSSAGYVSEYSQALTGMDEIGSYTESFGGDFSGNFSSFSCGDCGSFSSVG